MSRCLNLFTEYATLKLLESRSGLLGLIILRNLLIYLSENEEYGNRCSWKNCCSPGFRPFVAVFTFAC